MFDIKIYTSVSLELITPKVGRVIDSYVKQWHDKKLSQADLPSMLGELTGYNLITTQKNCGGYHDSENKVVALRHMFYQPYTVLFHEIGHCIQAELEILEKRENLISEELSIEWQAESISWQLYNKCFMDKKQDASKFSSYMTKDHWLFLINWYGSSKENDMEKYLVCQ